MEQSWNNYGRDYYYSHQREFRAYQRKYLDKIRSAIIYKVLDNDEILYFGSTDSRFRMNFHYTRNSKLNLKENSGTIYYAEIEELDREELYFIEYFLIREYNPAFNEEKPSLDRFCFSEERKNELINIANNLQFKIFVLQ
jgi:hypothetical protein